MPMLPTKLNELARCSLPQGIRQPEDVASVVAYLASKEARCITVSPPNSNSVGRCVSGFPFIMKHQLFSSPRSYLLMDGLPCKVVPAGKRYRRRLQNIGFFQKLKNLVHRSFPNMLLENKLRGFKCIQNGLTPS